MSTGIIELRRGSTLLDSTTVVDANVGVVMLYVDAPAAGTYTYKIRVDGGSATPDMSVGKRTLVALVAKK